MGGGDHAQIDRDGAGDAEQAHLAPSEDSHEKLRALLPLQRFGKKEDIANLALFLASPAASYVTGAIMVCDGGQSLLGSGSMMQALGV